MATEEKFTNVLREAFHAEELGDLPRAINLFKSASRMGSNDARSKLGTIFDDVLDKANPKRAIYWYKRGVAAGDGGCAWNLAMHYAGSGRRRGYLYWLRIAEKMGDTDARNELESNAWWKKRNP